MYLYFVDIISTALTVSSFLLSYLKDNYLLGYKN